MRYELPTTSEQGCKSSVFFDIPPKVPAENVLFTGEMAALPPVSSIKSAVLDALTRPIGTPPLAEALKQSGKQKILFLMEDATRATPLADIMPVIIEYLHTAGIKDGDISFLTAPGTHRVMTDAEIKAKLGVAIAERYAVYQHDATKKEDLVKLGTVMAGDYPVPVEINKRVLDGSFLIGLGNIVPHSDAGFSGGAKILQPGVCGVVTTAATHAAAGFCDDIPLGMKEGNPCRAGIEAVAKLAGLSFIVNTVKNSNDEVCGIFAGDVVKAHRAGADMAERAFKVAVRELADVVVVSSYPADIDFWQASKALCAAYFAVKQGGIIVLAAPCPEGLATNHPRFLEWLAEPLDTALVKVRQCAPEDEDADVVAGVIALCVIRACTRASVFSVTRGLDTRVLDILGFRPFADVQQAVNEALRRKPGAKIGILPRGGISLPVITGDNS
jgi:nickel-dependent lactate racemase